MTTYEAPELITMGEATHIVRQGGTQNAETGCGCGHWLFFDGDPLNTDEDFEDDAAVSVAGETTEPPRPLEL